MSYRHAVRTAGVAALGLLLVVAVTPSASASPSAGTSAVRTSAAASTAVVQGKDPKKGKDKLDKAAKKAAKSVGAWYVDDATGTVVLESTNTADAQSFAAAAGTTAEDAVQVKQVAQVPRPFYNLVGGQAIYNNGGRCSVGFSATAAAGAFVITAGHCTEGGGTWSGYNQVAIGPVAASHFPDDDFGSIKVNSTTTWVPTSQVQGTTSVLGSTEAAVGATVCRSGSTTGYRCGTVQSKNATVNYGGGDIVYGLTRTNACAEPGDSGGSFVAGRQAQGMTSGGSGDCTSGGTTYFQPVNEALSRLGLTLVTG